ncbi:hypothetical protein NECAME_12128 [Necator americanus]|uniref:Hedgehog protein Hint domain-containing protein n=1 Tax=Necator americanus TaxID=51031 RepID=W2T3J9_NECAM|nr:hypothetical protein NECAME_12128 [Necator americanus]ETN75786.1 hypothetical protein NECAME_12128 [Necator americanus]
MAVDCNNDDFNVEMIYAENLRAGDCLYRSRADSLHKIHIRSVFVVEERGVYAPMTKSGDLLANDIYMRSLFGGAEDGHLPTTAEFFLNMVDYIIPTGSKFEL